MLKKTLILGKYQRFSTSNQGYAKIHNPPSVKKFPCTYTYGDKSQNSCRLYPTVYYKSPNRQHAHTCGITIFRMAFFENAFFCAWQQFRVYFSGSISSRRTARGFFLLLLLLLILIQQDRGSHCWMQFVVEKQSAKANSVGKSTFDNLKKKLILHLPNYFEAIKCFFGRKFGAK